MFDRHTERVAIYIDGPNLTATAKALRMRMDFQSMVKAVCARGSYCVGINYYTAIHTDDGGNVKIQGFVDALAYNGFQLHTKPAKEFGGVIKGNMDVELCVDMLQMAPHVDRIILFTGDGDFVYLVKALQQLGKNVTVVSTISTRPAMIADELRKQASSFVDLQELRNQIEKFD